MAYKKDKEKYTTGADFTPSMIRFNCIMLCITVYICYMIQFINIHIFDIEIIYLQILFFKVLINLSTTTDFSSLCVEYNVLLKFAAFINPYFVLFPIRLI